MYLSSLSAVHPPGVLTNEDLARMVDTSGDWIVEHVGIRERRRMAAGDTVHELGARAARETLAGALEPVELVVCALSVADFHIPATANLVAAEAGCPDAAAFDVRAACSSFLFALHALRGMLAAGLYRNVLLVVPEAYTKITDYRDRNSCVLWGDAAFACLVTSDPPAGRSLHVLHTQVGSASSGARIIHAKVGGFFTQDGPAVQRFAIKKMAEVVNELAARGGKPEWLIGHQANLGILERVAARTGIAPERNLVNIQKYGNCGAAGAPTVLAQSMARFAPGERVALATVGSGLSWGGALLETCVAKESNR